MTPQKSELLKGLLAVIPKMKYWEGECGGLKEKDVTRNQILSEVRTRLEVWVGGLSFEIDEDEIEKILQLRYFKLMQPDITESDAEIVAGSLAKVLASKGSLLIKVRGEK